MSGRFKRTICNEIGWECGFGYKIVQWKSLIMIFIRHQLLITIHRKLFTKERSVRANNSTFADYYFLIGHPKIFTLHWRPTLFLSTHKYQTETKEPRWRHETHKQSSGGIVMTLGSLNFPEITAATTSQLVNIIFANQSNSSNSSSSTN